MERVMKKLILFLIFFVGLGTISPVFGAFERLRNFFGGGRYYYYDDYYYPSTNRYYYTASYPAYTSPRYRYYYTSPRYTYYDPVVNTRNDTNIAINEDDNNYTVSVVLPGYNKSDIKVSALERNIQVNANAPRNVQGSTLPLVTTIEQVIPLNSLIKPEAVTSTYENGILTITAPKFYGKQAISVPIE
jgi:HSP20 family molecular chaperone IbpA